MKKLGNVIQDKSPEVKKLIERRRYVDDIGDSKAHIADCRNLAWKADEDFALVGLTCKCWTFSGEDPDMKVSRDGVSVSVAGCQWFPKLDCDQSATTSLWEKEERQTGCKHKILYWSNS